jgi:hypothetical protein
MGGSGIAGLSHLLFHEWIGERPLGDASQPELPFF